ncbi:MAG: hypothetical protein VX640_10160 [Pseudomonadota bacterium]|nr:hypothetical protein [Pseudomonadota bacterium]
MIRDLTAAFAAPAVAIFAIGVSAALASGLKTADYAYGGTVGMLSADQARAHAETIFNRADLDRSGALDADEYASLAIVSAELSRLNGFIAIETGGDSANIVPLPVAAPSALSQGERARVEAVARSEFYVLAGDDALLTADEYLGEQAARFDAADRNRNGALAKGELASFAAREARLSGSDA